MLHSSGIGGQVQYNTFMILSKINLTNFRNIDSKSIDLHENVTIITGPNSIGKTNILESIYLLMTGSGIKDEKQDELVRIGEKIATIEGIITSKESPTVYRVYLERNDIVKKVFSINKTQKRLFEYSKQTIPAVFFTPKLVHVIDGEPASRRKFIDRVLSKLDIEYKKRLTNYESALRKRNKVLERVYNVSKLKDELTFWDDYLIEQATYICNKRAWFVNQVNTGVMMSKHEFRLEYNQKEISKKTLAETFDKQYLLKSTRVGPHRDSYEIIQKNLLQKNPLEKNVHQFGSRSEQRLALFWIIVNELKLYEEIFKIKPLLLLDDIFSELDETNREYVIDLIGKYQTIITKTDEEIIKLGKLPHSTIQMVQ